MTAPTPISSRAVATWIVVAIPAMLAFYLMATRPFARWSAEVWHRVVALRLVEPASTLAERAGWDASRPDSASGTPRWLGTYRPELPWDFTRWYQMQDTLRTKLRIASWYQAWGDGPDHEFKREAMRNLHREGIVPMITWEPWVGAFDEFRGRNPHASLELVVAGRFDAYLRTWAREAAIHGKPFLLRPFHEPGNPWYPWGPDHGNSPELFRAAWSHVRGIFREEGAVNAAFVWTPWNAADTSYWPGDDEVDWIGLDLFNYGTLAEGGIWMDFESLLRLQYDIFRHHDKPMFVAEAGTSDFGGSKSDWYRDLFGVLRGAAWPRMRAVVLFDNPSGTTATGLPVDWALSTTPGAMDAIGRSLPAALETEP